MDAKVEMVEGPWELPIGWCWATLGGLGTWTGGGTPSKSNAAFWADGTVPWVSPKDMKTDAIGKTEDLITEEAVEKSSAKYVSAGSILMVMRSGILRHSFPVAIAERTVTLNQDLRALTPYGSIESSFVARYLNLATRRVLDDCSKDGTTVNSIEVSALERLPVPVAPLSEQRRIVERIDALFAEIAEGEAALDDARQGLETFRRALLTAAVTGELTRDWRENNKPAETGHDLLARIRAEREGNGEAGGRRKRRVAQQVLDTSDLSDLPDGWTWATLDEVKIADQRNGISIAGAASPPGAKALRLDALKVGRLDLDAVRYIPLSEARIRDYRVNSGDLLVSRANGSPELVGRSVFVETVSEEFVFPDTMIRYPLGAKSWLGRWIEMAWNSPLSRSQIRALAKTTAGILKISQEDIAQIALPLPPPAEAIEILRRVSEALSALSDTTAMLETEAADAARLRQSILKAAFEGKLVEQDPDDEPATALLARIGAGNPSIVRTRRRRATR